MNKISISSKSNNAPQNQERKNEFPIVLMHLSNIVISLVVAVFFLLIPFLNSIRYISDNKLINGGIPEFAADLHKNITDDFSTWAKTRLSKKNFSFDISSTEWPLFCAVFYLWSTEEIQKAWEKDSSIFEEAPLEYAKEAVDLASKILTDEKHGLFVRNKWGENYLHNENVFYRTMLIGGLTSHYYLTGNEMYLETLTDQTESLARELDESKNGLLNDYPGECYPAVVLMAYACIVRAGKILGKDKSDVAANGMRAFISKKDPVTGIPPFATYPEAELLQTFSYGCSSALICIFGPEIYDSLSEYWFDSFMNYYWQEKMTGTGFREYSRHLPPADNQEWGYSVDAGPVIFGYGITASSFGLGAARANGEMGVAYSLSTEMIVLSYPVAKGRPIVPKALSDLSEAPLTGELGILFNLTRQPQRMVKRPHTVSIPALPQIILVLYVLLTLLIMYRAYRRLNFILCRKEVIIGIPLIVQLIIWSMLIGFSVYLFAGFNLLFWILLLLLTRFFPLYRKIK